MFETFSPSELPKFYMALIQQGAENILNVGYPSTARIKSCS